MLTWDRDDQLDSVFDKTYFGSNKITVYKFASDETFKMWFHMDGQWKIRQDLEAKNFEDAHAEAIMVVRDYINENMSFWMDMFYDLWKADQWVDEEDE